MSYKTKSKITSVTLGFDRIQVASVALVPNKHPSPEAIKLKPENLQNVFDPMGATLAMSDTSASDACNRTIPVFDGKVRFDLMLSLKGRERIKRAQAFRSTQGTRGMPCEIRSDCGP